VSVERHLLRGTISFLTIRESGHRLPARASELYQEVARARGVSVACIRLHVIAIRCRLADITGPSSEASGTPHRFRIAYYASANEFESPKFRSGGRPAREGALRKGARPCPQRPCWGCVTLTFPYDTTNCLDPSVQGSWALWAGAMRYVDELRIDGVLRRSYSPGPTPVSVPDSDRLLLGTILTSHNAPRRLCSSQAPWWRRMYGG